MKTNISEFEEKRNKIKIYNDDLRIRSISELELNSSSTIRVCKGHIALCRNISKMLF